MSPNHQWNDNPSAWVIKVTPILFLYKVFLAMVTHVHLSFARARVQEHTHSHTHTHQDADGSNPGFPIR